jgi:8-oxo-dGTP pyrophosphatase MutT (NUDIX family)
MPGWRDMRIRLPLLRRQVGVIAWLPGPGPLRFALVTSRRTGRWVFPKGSVDAGQTPQAAAAREAMEEAGVAGRPEPAPVGSFRALKVRAPFVWPIEVAIYPMRIDRVLEDWPESGQRDRRFVTLDEARHLLRDRAMLDVAERFAAGRSDLPRQPGRTART